MSLLFLSIKAGLKGNVDLDLSTADGGIFHFLIFKISLGQELVSSHYELYSNLYFLWDEYL